jgi:hypothetical protein
MAKPTPVIDELIKSRYPGWEGYLNLDAKKPSNHKIERDFLSSDICEGFVDLIDNYSDQFLQADKRRAKIGFNGRESQFKILNYFDFPRPLKKYFKENLPETILSNYNEAWIMRFDPNDFFDLWFAPESCFYQILSISLLNTQQFLIDYKDILVDAGDLVKFEARIPHEVPASSKTNYYLNFLQFNNNCK